MTGLLEEQLPVVMAGDPNLVRFVQLVDPTASELYDRVSEKETLFHPATAPPPIVRWLARLLALPIADDVRLDVQRAVVAEAARAFPRRGTEGSLRTLLSAIAQAPVSIEETGWVRCVPAPTVPPRMPVDPMSDAESLDEPMWVRIVVGATDATDADLRAVIERELRADVPYELVIRRREPIDATTEGPTQGPTEGAMA